MSDMTREEAIEVIEQDIPCEHDKDLIEALDMAISALQKNENGELVDKLKQLRFFNQRAGRELWGDKPREIQDKDIENADTILSMAISALSENTGEWISTEDRPDGFCSKCDTDIYEVSTPYCPYCGAKMTWVGAIHEPYKKGE